MTGVKNWELLTGESRLWRLCQLSHTILKNMKHDLYFLAHPRNFKISDNDMKKKILNTPTLAFFFSSQTSSPLVSKSQRLYEGGVS